MTLEETLSRFAEMLELNRASNWTLGDIAAEAVREHGQGVIGKLAEVARCSRERIKQLIRVAVTFDEEQRYPDVDWSVYRAAYYAAKRIEEEPGQVLIQVLERELSLKDIAVLGTGKKTVAKLSKRCEWCGAKVIISVEGLAGTKILCPVCLAVSGENRVLGVLEGCQHARYKAT